ncbi:filamentous hemagglutinin [Aphanothece hegewaldii CCALA 016]|uniref:Filamentous hemagglutinin n=1 Tax=Aphanothece hegewaldii CCALA 016 TaxID=2107694 RepID=A0A2T1LQE2_9CHRO|nr:glycosyltransferase [Aphanothece hegewaldii]PSF27580.1 filamentous hemagglutinin [Aphanothece hegewaldii CCALA 016]
MNVPISLIITVYNRERYLAKAIESVLAQTLTDFELLILDDGSTDGSVEIARHYEKQDNRIKVIVAPHTGRGQALYDAIAITTGKYLGIVDSDDLLAPTTLAETAHLLDQQPDVGMVYTDYLVIDEKGTVLGLGKRCKIPYSSMGLLVDFMTFHFRLIRRSAYKQVGGVNPEFKAAQDYDLCLRLDEVTKIAHFKKPLYYYRTHQDNISHLLQLEQIQFTQMAIAQALQRRGLSEKLVLEVEVQAQYRLRPLTSAARNT